VTEATGAPLTTGLLDWISDAFATPPFPPATRRFTEGLLLKTVVSMVIGSGEPFGRQIAAYGAERAGPPEASVVGGDYRTSLESAALVNGTLAHQTESEDCYFTTDTRESASTAWIFPAVLSAAELLGSPGRDVVTASVIAFEAAARMLVASPGLGSVHGINTASWFGAPASAAAVALLLGASTEQVGNAMSIALSQSSGLGQQTGYDSHKLEAGVACRSGVLSAYLATGGAVGAPDFLDTGLAFAPVLPDGRLRPHLLLDGLGEPPFFVDRVEYKKYPACGMLHAAVDGLAALRAREGWSADDVDSITVVVDPVAAEYCDRPSPTTVNEARFSYSFALASVLAEGRVGYDTYTEDALRDPLRARLQRRVEVRADADDPPAQNGARLVIRLRDGDEVRQEFNGFLGHPASPIPVDTMVALLRQDLRGHGATTDLDRIVELTTSLDDLDDVGELFGLLRELRRPGGDT
jgi:2-methylcitrate dehydratase PrpD